MSKATKIIMGSFVLATMPAWGDEKLKGLLQRPPIVSYKSTQSSQALEECFGIALSSIGIPSVIHGDGRTIISAWPQIQEVGPRVAAVVTLRSDSSGTMVEVRGRPPGMIKKSNE